MEPSILGSAAIRDENCLAQSRFCSAAAWRCRSSGRSLRLRHHDRRHLWDVGLVDRFGIRMANSYHPDRSSPVDAGLGKPCWLCSPLCPSMGASGWTSRRGPPSGTLTTASVPTPDCPARAALPDTDLESGWRWHGSGGIATTTIEIVPVGTLVVDIYETGTHHLVWRGLAHDTLSDNPNTNAKKLEKAIDKMFRKFPATLS